ncbi:hypothetical protein BH23ACT7_BH23ACT7_05800 [soil metagenome]|nr:LysM peptidoglycan-binding domain-containing protein [Euzebyaceae bacterium]
MAAAVWELTGHGGRVTARPGPPGSAPARPHVDPRTQARRAAPGYGRRRLAAVVLLALAALAPVAVPRWSTDPPSATGPAPVTVVVRPGDTVWSLALPHTPAGTGPMEYVAQVVEFNGVDARALTPGAVLRLPRH